LSEAGSEEIISIDFPLCVPSLRPSRSPRLNYCHSNAIDSLQVWLVITKVITLSKVKNKKKNTAGKDYTKNYGSKISLPANSRGKEQIRKAESGIPFLKEPDQSYSVSSRIRAIGNSKGVILSNRVIREAGISPDADLIIQVIDGVILIAEAKSAGRVNTDLPSWDEHYKNAIKNGNKPEPDEWEGMQNRFDEEEWT
jgi:antitoxin component of MazEF toxin-antitoxin module